MKTRWVAALCFASLIVLSGCQAQAQQPQAVETESKAEALPAAVSVEEPAQAVQAFYDWYLDYIGSSASGDFRDPLVDDAYLTSPHLSPSLAAHLQDVIAGFGPGGGYDPFLCAQDIPTQVNVDAAFLAGELAGNTAHVLVRSDLGGHVWTADLRQEEGEWKIADVVCGNTPEGLARAFYTWYLATMGNRASGEFRNPVAEGLYRNSEFLSARLVDEVDGIVASFDRGGYDPFLQAQDIPQGFSVDPGLSGDSAVVHLLFGRESVRHLQVSTVLEEGRLCIDGIILAEAPGLLSPGDRGETPPGD